MESNNIAALNQIPDVELIERIEKGEHRLFEIIVRRHNQRLYRIGKSILEQEDDIEDAMQSAYINAFLHMAKFEKRSLFSTWLSRIMVNQCYEHQRKNKLNRKYLEQQVQPINMKSPEIIAVNNELNKVLEHAIESLPEKYRMVFVLRELEGLSIKETSEILEIEEPNVKVRLNRAKNMLKEGLSGYMKEHVYSFHLNRCDKITNYVLDYLKIS